MLTITESIDTYMSYTEELRLFNKVPAFIRKRLRHLQRSIYHLVAQSKRLHGQNQEMIRQIVDSEVTKFYEAHGAQLCEVDEAFEDFGKRLLAFSLDHIQKQAIVLTCRVHPGEAQSNHMLSGLLKALTSDSALALRQNFIFRIVPMLNPDGVVFGNYRCSQLGCDLNRKWNCASRLLQPSVFYTLQMMKIMRSQVKI